MGFLEKSCSAPAMQLSDVKMQALSASKALTSLTLRSGSNLLQSMEKKVGKATPFVANVFAQLLIQSCCPFRILVSVCCGDCSWLGPIESKAAAQIGVRVNRLAGIYGSGNSRSGSRRAPRGTCPL